MIDFDQLRKGELYRLLLKRREAELCVPDGARSEVEWLLKQLWLRDVHANELSHGEQLAVMIQTVLRIPVSWLARHKYPAISRITEIGALGKIDYKLSGQGCFRIWLERS